MEKTYIAIDLKSFYASVECQERGLDPLTTNLVVADLSRTEKTICLAVSPSLKAYGISGRARLYEVVEKVKEINLLRQARAPGRVLKGSSYHDPEVRANPSLALDYIAAPPRMKFYMDYSTTIYNIYLKYVAPEDIHVYSIDEVFIDATGYLKLYKLTAREFTMKLIREVLFATGITATAGIGTNLYLCKIAMDIVAKHVPPDKDGVRIAELDERTYRQQLWDHRPLTDFWRIGKGISRKLEAKGMFTMGDVARCSLTKEGQELLYKLFGINAELLIDHAWGVEPVTIREIREYRPETNSLSYGQVLSRPYSYTAARQVAREMTEQAALDLTEKKLRTDQLVLTVNYDNGCLNNPEVRALYTGPIMKDWYGKDVPKYAHGTANTGRFTASLRLLTAAAMEVYDRTVNKDLTVRRITICLNHVVREGTVLPAAEAPEQLSLFEPTETALQNEAELDREQRRQEAIVELRRRYGKNVILTGSYLTEDSTVVERNGQIGGHKA